MSAESSYRKEFEATVKGIMENAPEPVIAGISGGSDSVALLLALAASGRKILAVHCNFSLRGEESDRDQQFVEDLCRRLGVELMTAKFDTRKYMSEHSLSLEMACRELRYDLFRRLMSEGKGKVIAVGHHRDDNVETMLINLLRGSGIEGAKGMAVHAGDIIRPLLGFSRHDILGYLKAAGETFITDSSNLTSEPLRNFLRLEVIPLLESRIPHAAASLERSRKMLERAARVYTDANRKWHTQSVSRQELLSAPDLPTAVHEFMKGRLASAAAEEEIARFVRSGSTEGKRWILPGCTLASCGDSLIFIPDSHDAVPDAATIECGYPGSFPEDISCVYLPSPPGNYIWSYPVPGMRMRISPSRRKKIADILAEAGIPAPVRNRIPILMRKADNEPIWIPYIRRAAIDKIGHSDTHIYKTSLLKAPFYCNWVKK